MTTHFMREMHNDIVCDFDEIFVRHFSPSFRSYAELTQTLKKFEHETGTSFCIRSCKRRQEDDELVYSSIFYWCSRSNNRKSTSLGFRHTRPILKPRKVHCGARFSVVICGDVLRISSFNMRHNHHPTKNWSHEWGGVHDRLKGSGIQQMRINSRRAVSVDQFKKLMRRELDFRFPSRPKRSQSEVDEYRFHCLNSSLPKLIRSYRQFEAGARKKYPEKLLSKLDLVIKHYQDEIKASSLGATGCRLSPAGRLVATAVQEIVCALCCSFAYCDLFLCKLCSWRAHVKCAKRLGISSCPRCPIESNLKHVRRPLGFDLCTDLPGNDSENTQELVKQNSVSSGPPTCSNSLILSDNMNPLGSCTPHSEFQLTNFDIGVSDSCVSVDISAESIDSELSESLNSAHTVPCVFSRDSDILSDAGDTLGLEQFDSNVNWAAKSQSLTRFKRSSTLITKEPGKLSKNTDGGTLRRLLTSASHNEILRPINVAPESDTSLITSVLHNTRVLRCQSDIVPVAGMNFSFDGPSKNSQQTKQSPPLTSVHSESSMSPYCAVETEFGESFSSSIISVCTQQNELADTSNPSMDDPIPSSCRQFCYQTKHLSDTAIPQTGRPRFVAPNSLVKSSNDSDVLPQKNQASSNCGTLRDLLTDKKPLWSLKMNTCSQRSAVSELTEATGILSESSHVVLTDNTSNSLSSNQPSESSRAATVLISLLEARKLPSSTATV